jgi:hypothetical protein
MSKYQNIPEVKKSLVPHPNRFSKQKNRPDTHFEKKKIKRNKGAIQEVKK